MIGSIIPKMGRDDFSRNVQQLLAQRAGFRCAAPTCRAATVGPGGGATKSVSVGVAAHITAASPGGPRFDESLTGEQRSDISNGIWLCQTHAREIDVDPQRYPSALLRQWRDTVEADAAHALGKPEQQAGRTNTDAAKQVLRRTARLPDSLFAFLDEIASLPNSTIEHTYPGVENERGRAELRTKYSRAAREARSEAQDAAAVLQTPDVSAIVERLFTLEASIRQQFDRTQVPRVDRVTSTPEWAEFTTTAAELRAFVQ